MESILLLGAALGLLGAGTALADFQPSRWELVRPIHTAGATEPFVSVVLDREILENSRADLADLRIIGRDREEAPYVVEPETAPLGGASFRTERDPETKTSTIAIDCGYLHARPALLEFDFEDEALRRPYTIYGRDAETLLIPSGRTGTGEPVRREAEAPWVPLGSGVFLRLPPKRRGEKPIDEARIVLVDVTARFLRVVMEDEDDRPLRLRGMSAMGMVPRLVFPARAGGAYFIYYRNPEASPPRYNLAALLPDLDTRPPAAATLGASRPNPLRGVVPEAPLTDRHPWMLWVVMVAAVAAGASMIMRSARPPSSAT
jgi:hypothetical protein